MVTHGWFRRFASAVVAFGLGVRRFVAIAPAASAAPVRATRRRTRSSPRTAFPGSPPSRVGRERRRRPVDPGLRDPDQRQPRRDRALQGRRPTRPRTTSTSTASVTTAATARATSRRQPDGDAPADAARVPRTTPHRLIDCGNWAESASWAVPGRPRSPASTSPSCTAPTPHGARATSSSSSATTPATRTCCSRPRTRRGRRTTATAATACTRARPAGRAYKVSYNRPFTTREHTPEDCVFNAEYPMVRWLERNGYDIVVHRGRRHRPLAAASCCSSTRCSCRSGHDEYWSGEPARQRRSGARRRGAPRVLQRQRDLLEDALGAEHRRRRTTDHRTLVSYKETHAERQDRPVDRVDRHVARPARRAPHDGGRPENALSGTIFMVNCCTYTMQVPGGRRRPAVLAQHAASPARRAPTHARRRARSATSGTRTSTTVRGRPGRSTCRRRR